MGAANCGGWRRRWPGWTPPCREQEAELAAARQQIASAETTLGHEWALADDLEADLAQKRRRLSGLSLHVQALGAAARSAAEELREGEGLGETARREVEGARRNCRARRPADRVARAGRSTPQWLYW